ncbi:MAG TPA: GNAT family N-acetyltransferase [Acidimicrobiales bacterium]|nr:GNAT family N-acetyltransferase [Acidimicrobiales bacterium]
MDEVDQGDEESTSRGRLLGELAARATVAAEQESIDGWWLKVADLPFRRCNAVLPSVGAGLDAAMAERALDAVERWYAARGRRVVVQVSSVDPGAEALDALLAERGYEIEAPVHLHTCSIERSHEAGPARAVAPGVRVEVREGIDEEWARHYGAAHGVDGAARGRTGAYGRMLRVLAGDALGVAASVAGAPAGVGFGVLDQGWLGIFGMGLAPTFRGRGVATAVVRALLERAAERGATGAYLQVETDNPVAISLYEGLGFRRDHGYHYRVSATPGALPSGC